METRMQKYKKLRDSLRVKESDVKVFKPQPDPKKSIIPSEVKWKNK